MTTDSAILFFALLAVAAEASVAALVQRHEAAMSAARLAGL